MTSRIAGYPGTTEISEFTIKPFADPEDARSYVAGWLHALQRTPPEAALVEAMALLAKMQQQTGLRRVLSNPLFLRLAVAVYVDSGEVATNRAELYRRYVEEVAWRRAEKRERCPWNRTQVGTALEIVAWTLHAKGPQTASALGKAIESNGAGIQDGGGLVAYLREPLGLLAIYGYDRGELVGFRHLTFQEYFVAVALDRAWRRDQKATWQFLRPKLHLARWREAILLAAGMLDERQVSRFTIRIWKNAHSPYERYLHRDQLLAAAIVSEGTQVQSAIVDRLTESLVELYLDVAVLNRHRLVIPIVGLLVLAMGLAALYIMPWYTGIAVGLTLLAGLIAKDKIYQMLTFVLTLPWRWRGRSRYKYLRHQVGNALAALPQPQRTLASRKLAKVLESPYPRMRELAAAALGVIQDSGAALPLIYALEDGYWGVRHQATLSLTNIGPSAVPFLLQALDATRDTARQEIAGILGSIGDQASALPLIRALSDPDQAVRTAVVVALGQIADPRAVPSLIETLNDPSLEVREAAIVSLTRIGDSQAVLPIASNLDDLNPRVRKDAVVALREIEDPQVVRFLIQALNDLDQNVCKEAAQALGKIGDQLAIAPLLVSLSDPSEELRKVAAWALTKIGNLAATPLMCALEDPDQLARAEIIFALGEIGLHRSIEHLICFLDDRNPEVRSETALALGKIGTSRVVIPLIEALDDPEASVRRNVALALGKTGDALAVSALIKAADDLDSSVRWEVVAALERIGNVQAMPVLMSALKDPDHTVRWKAASALGKLGDENAVSALEQALSDANPMVLRSVVQALGGIKSPQAVEILIRALKDSNSDTREAASSALGQAGVRSAVIPLVQTLSDPWWNVQSSVVAALWQLIDPDTALLLERVRGHPQRDVPWEQLVDNPGYGRSPVRSNDTLIIRHLWFHLANPDSMVANNTWMFISRLVGQIAETNVAAQGTMQLNPSTELRPGGFSSTLLIVAGILIAAISGVTSNIVAAYLQMRFDLTDTSRFLIVGITFGLTLVGMIWLSSRQSNAPPPPPPPPP